MVAIPVVVDLLLRPVVTAVSAIGARVAIPVVVDLLLRLKVKEFNKVTYEGRNPCCSGPTPSTYKKINTPLKYPRVAIPVVVDLLLRPEGSEVILRKRASRNPCCSGPTPSTP